MDEQVIVKPLPPKEQQELMDRAERALGVLRIIHDCSVRDNGDNEFADMIQSAIDIFSEMRGQWALAVGNPQEISKETLEKIANRTIDVMKDVLKAQIDKGKL